LSRFGFTVQAALGIFNSVGYCFNYVYRQRMDFVGKRSLPLRQQRPDGSALWTPATFEKVG